MYTNRTHMNIDFYEVIKKTLNTNVEERVGAFAQCADHCHGFSFKFQCCPVSVCSHTSTVSFSSNLMRPEFKHKKFASVQNCLL